jgi:hypothetical protein
MFYFDYVNLIISISVYFLISEQFHISFVRFLIFYFLNHYKDRGYSIRYPVPVPVPSFSENYHNTRLLAAELTGCEFLSLR